MDPVTNIIKDLSINVAASLIFDTSRKLFAGTKIAEIIQTIISKIKKLQEMSDFPERYIESLIALREISGNKAVPGFFHDECVMRALYDFYYAPESTGFRENEEKYHARIYKFVDELKKGDALKDSGANIEKEINRFREIFNQQIHKSRTVKEAELITEVKNIKKTIHENFNRQNDTNKLTLPKELTLRIPHRPEDKIVGRQSELNDVHNRLFDHKQVLVVNGMGGVGKTTLAQVYVDKYKDEYNHIAWINQITGDFVLDLVNTEGLKEVFKIESAGKDTRELVMEILANLKCIQESPCLLVIDNAQSSLYEWYDALPGQPVWQILVTSRQKIEHFEMKELGFLLESEAIALFYSHYKHNELQVQEVQDLVKAVDYHTLTIEILARIAQSRRTPVGKLLQAIEKDIQVGVYIPHKNDKIQRITSYLCSIFRTSDLNDDELGLLKQFTCLPPENHTYHELIGLLIPGEGEEKELFTSILEGLCANGWILFNEETETYKMHRIIGEVVRIQQTIVPDNIINLLNVITVRLIIDQTKDNPVHKFPWITYGKSILNALKDSDDLIIALLQNNLALVLKALEDYEGAKVLLEKALASDEKNFGSEHPTTAVRYSNLALVLQALGDYDTALKLAEKALKIFQQVLPPNHPHIRIVSEIYEEIKRDR